MCVCGMYKDCAHVNFHCNMSVALALYLETVSDKFFAKHISYFYPSAPSL